MPDSGIQAWLERAVEDEQVVAILKAAGGPWGIAAYHVQQAAGKRIKAALVSAGVAPPKTHDLPQLLSLLPGSTIPEDVELAAAMTSAFAWLTRYPGAPPMDEELVAEAERHLGTIREWTTSVIVASSSE